MAGMEFFVGFTFMSRWSDGRRSPLLVSPELKVFDFDFGRWGFE